MKSNKLPTQETLRHWLSYDEETGVFTWRIEPRPNRPLVGSPAGSMSNGYVFIGIRGYPQIGAHRLAWIYVHGSIPPGLEVDHIDVNPENNALSNLRLATSQQQKWNKRRQSNNKAGMKGAYYHAAHKGKKWRSQIKTPDGRLEFLGYYHTPEEAAAAYQVAAVRHFGDFARLE